MTHRHLYVHHEGSMAAKILICFPISDAPGLRHEAAQLALGLAAHGDEVLVFGPLGAWRHPLRKAGITATDYRLPGDEREFVRAIQREEPQILHAFGAEAAHLALPQTLLVGAGGVATLAHEDLARLNPTLLRTASTLFVPCEHLREQVSRRLPGIPVVCTGHLLAPPAAPPAGQLRFLADELGVQDGAPVVLMADHFRHSETQAARALIEAAPLITPRVPGVQIVIAGGGVRLSELEHAAIAVNEQLGYRAVLLPGHRDDIASLLALAGVAVGSGRFAMEALGAGVAVVAAGASGLMGTVTDESMQVADFTCCGRHGHLDPITPRGLAAEVVGLFTYPQWRARFAEDGQRRVMAQAHRDILAGQIATYYSRTAPSGVTVRTPQRITAVLPEDLRRTLFCLPAISALRGQFPLAKVTLVAAPAQVGLLRQSGLAETVVERPAALPEWPAFLRALWRPRADVCLTFADDPASTLIAGTSLAPSRLGFAEGPWTLLLTDHLHVRALPSPARALMLVHPLGIAAGGALPALRLPDDAYDAADRAYLAAGIEPREPVVLLCPGGEDERAWPRGHWAQLVRLLQDERSERLAVLGGGIDLPARVAVVPQPGDALLLAAVLARAAVVIAPDHDALHLADLLGIPTVGLYGPTAPDACSLPNPLRTPRCRRDLPCHPCAAACPERRCLHALTPADVATALVAYTPEELIAV